MVAVFGGVFAVGGGGQSVKPIHDPKTDRRAGRARGGAVGRGVGRYHGAGYVAFDLVNVRLGKVVATKYQELGTHHGY
mgnify:CR=1 FL=1